MLTSVHNTAPQKHRDSLNLGFLCQSLLRLNGGHLLKVKCCFAGSYPQQAVYPQQSTAPVYPPAMQMSPQAPPYTDTPPAYSEVTIAFIYYIINTINSRSVTVLNLSFHLCVCRYTSPDMCFHLRCLVSCLRCPLPTLVLRCLCPCSHTCLLGQWARMSPWLTIPWEPCTPLVQQWWWKAALMLVLASQQAAVFPSQWVSTEFNDLKEPEWLQLGRCWDAVSSYVCQIRTWSALYQCLCLFLPFSSPHLLDIPPMQLSWLPCRVPML